MSTRAVSQVVLWCLMMVGVFSPAHALTQEELVAKLQAAGYSQVRDIKSTPEGTAVKATKEGAGSPGAVTIVKTPDAWANAPSDPNTMMREVISSRMIVDAD
jgi:hypothetical protein